MNSLSLLDVVALVAALGSGVVAGIFFAFSTFVMKALGALPPAQGVAAMQAINVAVVNAWFLTLFFGTAVTGAILIIASILRWHDRIAVYWLVGGVLYIVGTLLVTMMFNVPRNEALAGVVLSNAEGARLWQEYLSTWTAWNHVRTAAALAAALSLVIAFRLSAS